MTNTQTILDFQPIAAEHRAAYNTRLFALAARGCEFTFANLLFWGEECICPFADGFLVFACFGKRQMYLYPVVSEENERAAIDAILADAASRGIPACITGFGVEEKARIEALYPERFRFFTTDASYDYVYDIHDLAELAGKKYDGKRNHVRRFERTHPDATFDPIGKDNLDDVRAMADAWFRERLEKDPDADLHGEERAIALALDQFDALALEGALLREGDRVVAFTVASRMSEDTFDVHFEKARADVAGAYAAINHRFARYLREKYPAVHYLDREEDMGIEGLRRAKESYHPHHRIKKFWMIPVEQCHEK